MSDSANLTGVLDELQTGIDGDRITLGMMLASLENRGFGALLLGPALIALLPTGAVPGVPTTCAVTILFVAGQLVAGKSYPWLPSWLRRRYIRRDSFERAYRYAAPVTRRVDRLVYPRVALLTRRPAPRLLALLCMMLALVMMPLEIVPFAAALPASAITLIGLGLSASDGLLVVFGLVMGAATLGFTGWIWFW